ncbi:putative quinol monooxygenase [Spirosoma radiotolerans]|uniref:ABM domain-containing protein n=1 Tax=Spirosoma radiotolerans TaxID=1379870 RepID=A0A0E3ZS21_9BACT|nr:putative quinol monooxygenase [Spirosoma radiotolerans]AKD53919.1 hypothetical protein SD10_02375 [Spirosoma radiotolerans]
MSNLKISLLVEVRVKAEYLDEVKALCAATLIPTLTEPGCEVFYQTSKQGDPTMLVFFEVFVSKEAFDQHLEAPYTKAFFAGIQGKLADKPVSTLLQKL